MSWFKISGMVLAGLLVLSSIAHAFLGWPMLRAGLEQAGVARGSESWNDAAAGWIFGSISMFVFGFVFGSIVLSLCKGPTNIVPIVAIGIGYLAFGIGGCIWIHVGLHFVAFAILGLIFLIWASAAKNWSCRRAAETP